MKYKVISVLLLLPVLLTLLVFTSSRTITLPTTTKADRIVLEHESLEAVKINSDANYRLYAHAIPMSASNSKLVYTLSDETMASIVEDGSNYYLKPKDKEGYVTVTVKTSDGSTQASFDVYLYVDKGEGAQEILISDSTRELNGIGNDYVYGRYDLDGSTKVNAESELTFNVLGTTNQGVDLEVTSGSARVSGHKVTFTGDEDVTIRATSKENRAIQASYTFDVIPSGVNVYSYLDLLECTNRSNSGEVVVMRTNLESRNNALVNPRDLSSTRYKNTELFGIPDGYRLKFETTKIESTFDTTYLDNIKASKELVVGINVKRDFYGNGFTINLHELCYPSQTVNGQPINGNNDLYKGPLAFVQAAGMATVYGQDNIGTLISGDGITFDNVQLKNCNNVSDLTHLTNVGTTLEIMGDDVTIVDSVISNGRTVLRSYSNENVTIDHSLLSHAREFILKIGSNSSLKPEKGQVLENLATSKADFLSPDLPLDNETGKYLSDSSMTIEDTFFYNSGFFSLGIETHFAGELLYDATQTSVGSYFPEVNNLAGTSYATYLDIKGDTRFYDWKDVESLDASTLIQVLDGTLDISKYFDLKGLVKDYITSEAGKKFAINVTEDGVAKNYVHGGIAFYGGGKNFSSVTLDIPSQSEGTGLVDTTPITLTGLITIASGTAPFNFKLYTNETNPSYFKEVPTIGTIKNL